MANKVYDVKLKAVMLDGVMNDPETELLKDHIADNSVHMSTSDHAAIASVSGIEQLVASATGDITVVIDRLKELEDQMNSLKHTDVLEITDLSAAVDATKDIVLTATESVLSPTPITGKSVTVNQATVVASGAKSAMLTVTAESGDVVLKNIDLSGDMSTTNNTVQLIVESDEYVRITDSVITASGYNAINIGDRKPPKSVVIDNVQFLGDYRNNTISIYGTKDNAVVTISNCVFKKSSNPLRIFNETNTKLTVNLINCVFEQWEETTPDYAGPILCEDAFTKAEFTKEELATEEGKAAAIAKEREYNRYSPDKVTINMINCTYKGKLIKFDNLSDVAGTKNINTQLIYVYNHVEGYVDFDEARYPKFTAK
ncbi:MAG: hypothetical protein IKA36_04165 [Clostridia bacterium]|nr:hypothetical protein [Clostridia bacterium]